jgi:hypothetical protein
MPLFSGPYGRLYLVLVIIVVVVVAVAVGLHYAYSSTSLASVTVEGGTVHLGEGQDANGYWFGYPTINFTGSADGYPLTLSAGATFTIQFELENNDVVNHTIEGVTVESPFTLEKTSFHIPAVIPTGNDVDLILTLLAPSTSGTYAFSVSITTD